MEKEHERWETLEELLLACAVCRHGAESWESIAAEIANRTPTLTALTPQKCIDKFNDLKRRLGGGGLSTQKDVAATDEITAKSLVDELTKIRIQELRREVQRRDMSIMSLESKVKRLEEERQRSLQEEKKADLTRENDGQRELWPETIAGKSSGSGRGDDDNRSFNESNSTGQKGQLNNDHRNDEAQKAKVKPEPDPVESGPGPDPNRNPDGANDRPLLSNVELDEEGRVKEGRIDTKASQGVSGPGELRESVSESKKGQTTASKLESSDVQSSSLLSKREKRRRRGNNNNESSGEEEPEVAMKQVVSSTAVKSEPLIKILGMIRSHRFGSAFERRHRSQDSERYKTMVRQHMDLQTIQSGINKGAYDSLQKFFRDLLLMFNNAIVFYKKNSHEHQAARQLQALVCKEMNDKLGRKRPLSGAMAMKSEPEQRSLFSKTTNKSFTVVGRGRGRASIKAISEERPMVNEKKIEAEQKGRRKRRNKDWSVSGCRNPLRTSNRTVEIKKHKYGGNELSSHDGLDMKVDRRETIRKKQGAASFLRRMKQNSSSEVVDNDDDDDNKDEDNEIEDEDDEADVSEEDDDEAAKQKKGRGRKKEKRTNRFTRCSRGSRDEKEDSGNNGRRGVGRPPKRQAAVAAEAELMGKRGRENGESETRGGNSGGRLRKRSRR